TPIASTQLGHPAPALIGDPDIGAIKGNTAWRRACGEGAQHGPVACLQFCDGVLAGIADPHTVSIKCNLAWTIAYGKSCNLVVSVPTENRNLARIETARRGGRRIS